MSPILPMVLSVSRKAFVGESVGRDETAIENNLKILLDMPLIRDHQLRMHSLKMDPTMRIVLRNLKESIHSLIGSRNNNLLLL